MCACGDVRLPNCYVDLGMEGELPCIFPDYTFVTVPENICPLNFRSGSGKVWAHIEGGGMAFDAGGGDFLSIDGGLWRDMLSKSDSIMVTVYDTGDDGLIVRYAPFPIYVSHGRVDKYLTYRLIEPGYEKFTEMGIYQRDLEGFESKAVFTSNLSNNGCMNCHSFCNRSADRFLFHLRAEYGATYIVSGGNIEKLDTKTPNTISNFVYPYWHPGGRFVAFSTNNTQQIFHAWDPNRIEVFDSESDVVVYDVESRKVLASPLLNTKDNFETFPTFSPDGKTLYFCSARARLVPDSCRDVRYSLLSIPFDEVSGKFGDRVDTVFYAAAKGRSVSLPRVSPDGRWMVFAMSYYGNFSIWHQESDLYCMDLNSGEVRCLDAVNSDRPESYHSFSSNSEWMVFSSRREDGLYTFPYLTHIDGDGNFGKPFLLPQYDPDYYLYTMKSFNIPEFSIDAVSVSPYDIKEAAMHQDAVQVR